MSGNSAFGFTFGGEIETKMPLTMSPMELRRSGIGIAGADADHGADIEVEFLGLALEQDRVVRERDHQQHVRLHVLELLDDRRHVGEELVIALVIDELDASCWA